MSPLSFSLVLLLDQTKVSQANKIDWYEMIFAILETTASLL